MNIQPLRDNLIITRKTPELTTSVVLFYQEPMKLREGVVQFI
jgi:hypothetical protein